ncbi:MarR family winged helix-turn-helix transcriptional regulator [Arthrobacter sp. NPDC097144]|uniref:MarR family winged helix-turn-helix transcriptional regulator n=1 Tax=Arthrobacter sp. NPDC097144 TaxID=3363946 RepID=UPI0037FCDF66
MKTPQRPAETSLELIRWVGWAQRKAAEEWIRERELSHEQAFVLGYVAQNPGVVQREIAEISRTTPASVTSLLQGLERRGLLERRADSANGRIKRAFATASGAELIAGFDDAMAAADAAILSPLNETEQAALHRLLTKVTAEIPPPSRT